MPPGRRTAPLLAATALLTATAATIAAAATLLPPAPTAVTATPGPDGATVSFTPATPPSGTSITSYTVIASPGKEHASGATSPIAVGGLQPATPYTFTVTSSTATARGVPSAPSAPVTTLAPTTVTPPALSALKISLVSFFAATHGGPTSPGKGTGAQLSYSDSEAATSTLEVFRVRTAVKRNGGCVVGTPRSKRTRCAIDVPLGSFTTTDAAGANTLHFSGRLAGHTLPAGLYEITITASVAGTTSNTLEVQFDVF